MMADLGTSGKVDRKRRKPKRAICLAGGGPAAGLHIGALQGLEEREISFDDARDVWALSCIGAWVGIVYNQAAEDDRIEETWKFFRNVFRNDESFKSFPINTIFAPDWAGNAEAVKNFLFDPDNYRNAFLPREIMKSFVHTVSAMSRRKRWRKFSEGDFNRWTLNHVLAVNPAVRFWTALMFKSEIDGLARLHYPDSRFLNSIDFKQLRDPDKPYIFHNAWNLTTQQLELFTNKPVFDRDDGKRPYKGIDAATLCACSALPYIEQTVKIGDDIYCEGALRDTVNFERLLEDHHRPNGRVPGDPAKTDDLEEIWINRIVDAQQIRKPRNLHDSLANLCEMFAATVGEDDVRLFKYHVKEDAGKRDAFTGTIVEIKVDSRITFEWSHRNLDEGRKHGRFWAHVASRLYESCMDRKMKKRGRLLIIPDDVPQDMISQVVKEVIAELGRP